jgi:uncharacterized Zn finger protein
MACRHDKKHRLYEKLGGLIVYRVIGSQRVYKYRCAACGEVHKELHKRMKVYA